MFKQSLNSMYHLELLSPGNKLPYSLLLLADETRYAIEKYVFDSDVYVLKDERREVAVFCLYLVDNEIIEIKNIAVCRELQGKGLGSLLIEKIIEIAQARGCRRVIVGTADCGVDQIRFYERNSFVKYAVRKDFFIHNYEEPIVENGIQLRDMIMLERGL